MMKVQLLLLLALAGPLCAFTLSASTVDPTHQSALPQATTEDTTVLHHQTATTDSPDVSVITGPPPTTPKIAAGVVTTPSAVAPTPSVSKTVVPLTEADAKAASTVPPLPTDPPATEPAATARPFTTIHRSADTEATTEATEAVQATTSNKVTIESDPEEELSTGLVVGIVIGALLAVAIVVAVVIAVLRRMGKYSSARNKKPAKKDNTMPLRKKSAKQQERAKFWKF